MSRSTRHQHATAAPPGAPRNPYRASFITRWRARFTTRRHEPDPLLDLVWPADPTLETLTDAVGAARDLKIVTTPIPEHLHHREVSGLTTLSQGTAYVFFDAQLAPLSKEQTILHELAHILHRDVCPATPAPRMRSVFTDPIEKRAEITGMRLMNALHAARLPSGPDRSQATVYDIFLGTDPQRRTS